MPVAPPDWPPSTGKSVVASRAKLAEFSVVLGFESSTVVMGSVMGRPSAFLFGILPLLIVNFFISLRHSQVDPRLCCSGQIEAALPRLVVH